MPTNKFGPLIFLIKTKPYGKINTIFIKIKQNNLKIMRQVAEGCYGRKEYSQINFVL